MVKYLYWNSVPDFSGYKPKAPGYLSQEKHDNLKIGYLNRDINKKK